MANIVEIINQSLSGRYQAPTITEWDAMSVESQNMILVVSGEFTEQNVKELQDNKTCRTKLWCELFEKDIRKSIDRQS